MDGVKALRFARSIVPCTNEKPVATTILVLAGSTFHYFSVLFYVLPGPATPTP